MYILKKSGIVFCLLMLNATLYSMHNPHCGKIIFKQQRYPKGNKPHNSSRNKRKREMAQIIKDQQYYMNPYNISEEDNETIGSVLAMQIIAMRTQ
jgi:hypothetical protein